MNTEELYEKVESLISEMEHLWSSDFDKLGVKENELCSTFRALLVSEGEPSYQVTPRLESLKKVRDTRFGRYIEDLLGLIKR